MFAFCLFVIGTVIASPLSVPCDTVEQTQQQPPQAELRRLPQERRSVRGAPPREADRAPLKTEVIRLKYGRASSVVEMLRAVFHPGRGVPGAIVVDSRTNSIVVSCSEDAFSSVARLISQLDVEEVSQEPLPDPIRRTNLQLVVFEVEVPVDVMHEIKRNELTARAETPTTLSAALEDLGNVRMLYRLDQIVELRRGRDTSLIIGASTPFVSGTTLSDSGQTSNSVQYQDVGCIVKLQGGWHAPPRGSARIDLELKSVTESGVELGNSVKAPVFRKLVQRFDGPISTGAPIVLLCIDGSAKGDTASAYVTRIQFDSTE